MVRRNVYCMTSYFPPFVLVRWHLETASYSSVRSLMCDCVVLAVNHGTAMYQVMNNWNRKIFLVIDGERQTLKIFQFLVVCVCVLIYESLVVATRIVVDARGAWRFGYCDVSCVAHKTPLLRHSSRLWRHIVYTCILVENVNAVFTAARWTWSGITNMSVYLHTRG